MYSGHLQISETECFATIVNGRKCNLNLQTPTPQSGQTQSNNSSAVSGELFECVWPFCEICA